MYPNRSVLAIHTPCHGDCHVTLATKTSTCVKYDYDPPNHSQSYALPYRTQLHPIDTSPIRKIISQYAISNRTDGRKQGKG